MNITTAPNFYTGTSGLLLPVRNKFFYPEEYKNRSRLCYYSSLMNSIEINSSFYKIPMASTVERWASEVSADFKFTFKLFREITHQKKLAFDPSIMTHFMEVIGSVGGKKGSLLVQFPPSVTILNIQQIRHLAICLRENDPCSEWNTSFEFRHKSLYDHEIYHVLEGLDIGIVIHDKSPANTPIEEKDQSFVMLGFMVRMAIIAEHTQIIF